jgi:polar amino acid transport system permease protein
MEGVHPAPPVTPNQGQAQLIVEQFRRQERRFTTRVLLSWLALSTLLLLVFSGLRLSWGPAGLVLDLPGLERTLLSLPLALPGGPLVLRTIRLDWAFIAEWAPYIATGVWQTIGISALSIVCATVLALLAALGRLSRIAPVYALSTFYVSLIRGTPLFLQVMFFFLALPQLGIVLRGLWAGVLALSLNYGAYMSEIFRAGILSVGRGQREAALALGMTYGQLMRRIVLPQALRLAVPPTGNEFIAMLKDSALVSATGFVHEILWRATRAGRSNFRNLEALIIAAVFYWVMTLVFSALQSRLEKRLSQGERQESLA